MKKKTIVIIAIMLVCILAIPLIYVFLIQRWIAPVSVSDEQITKLNCIYEHQDVLEKIIETSEGTQLTSVSEIKKVFETERFTREMYLEGNVLNIYYYFKEPDNSSFCDVYISCNNKTDFNRGYRGLCNYSSIEDLETMLSKEIGSFRPIYNKQVKKGSFDNVNYYISPITTSDRGSELYFHPTTSSDKIIHSAYEVGDYNIDICEVYFCSETSKYSDVLNDVGDLLNNATATVSE